MALEARSLKNLESENRAADREKLRSLPDEELLGRALKDPQLFGMFVERYEDGFLRAALRVVRSREEAEDIVQESLVKMYFRGHSFKKQDGATFKSWAYRILLNTAYSHYRKLQRRDVPLEEFFDTILFAEAQVQSREHVEAIDRREVVRRTMQEIPAELADLLRMHYFEGQSYSDIAEQTGLTTAALKMRLYRARKLFKEEFLNVNNLSA